MPTPTSPGAKCVNEVVKIGDYSFSYKCIECPFVTNAVTKYLAKMALFGEPVSGRMDFRSLQVDLCDEIHDTIDGNNASFGGGFYEDDCQGPNVTFNRTADNLDSSCGRKVTPFDTED